MARTGDKAPSRPAVALIGCGRWGRHILRDLVALGCPVHVVARTPESRERAREGGAESIVADIDSLPGVAGVVIATPTITHAEVIDHALSLEVPVYVEKPLTADSASARRLASGAPERLFVMDKWRYHPGVRELARIARSAELGEPVGLQSRRVGHGHRYSDVNSVWILAPHDLAIAQEVLGFLPELRMARGEQVGGELFGATAVLGDDPWVVLELSTLAPAHRRELRLICGGGAAWLDGAYADSVGIVRAGALDGTEPERRPIAGEMPLLAELRDFVEHLEGGPPPLGSAADAVSIVELVEQIIALSGGRGAGYRPAIAGADT